MVVSCPTCGIKVIWEGDEWRPFCSERCKLIDLGAWISEEYKIADQPVEKKKLKIQGSIDDKK
jgi:uncharacterized protein